MNSSLEPLETQKYNVNIDMYVAMYGKASIFWFFKLALLRLLLSCPHLTGCQRFRDADGCIWVLPGRWGLRDSLDECWDGPTVTTSKSTKWFAMMIWQLKPTNIYQNLPTISRSLLFKHCTWTTGSPIDFPIDFPINLQEALFPGSLKVYNFQAPNNVEKFGRNRVPYSGQTFVLNVNASQNKWSNTNIYQ